MGRPITSMAISIAGIVFTLTFVLIPSSAAFFLELMSNNPSSCNPSNTLTTSNEVGSCTITIRFINLASDTDRFITDPYKMPEQALPLFLIQKDGNA